MKRLLPLAAIAVAIVALVGCGPAFDSSQDITEAVITAYTQSDYDQMNLYQDEFYVRGEVPPSDVVSGEVTLRVTSTADPTGFTMTDTTTDETRIVDRVQYRYADFWGASVEAATFTDADRQAIKVAAAGDTITVELLDPDGEVAATDTFDIDCDDVLSMTYWADGSATLFLHGYDFDGDENPSVEMWTSESTTHITVPLDWNDPTQYQGLPNFNSYDQRIDFRLLEDGDASVGTVDGDPVYRLNYNEDEDQTTTVYVTYAGTTYVSEYGNRTAAPLEEDT